MQYLGVAKVEAQVVTGTCKMDTSTVNSSGMVQPIRRNMKRLILRTIDRGWLGLNPLVRHIVICGFPRSGSTLMLLIAETCVADAKTFGGQERKALGYDVQHAFRNHPI